MHTPGPWYVDPRKRLRVYAAADNTVATTGCTDGLREDWEANACLIAAAPEMYEALKSALEFHEAPGHGVWLAPHQWKLIRDAVAKAEGK